MVILSAFALFWQLFILSGCCLASGLYLRFLFPEKFSLLSKFLFSFTSGFFLVVLVPQNLVYLGMPCPNLCLGRFGRDSGPRLVVPSQIACLDSGIPLERRTPHLGGGHFFIGNVSRICSH
jgi:hypothetical protein